MYGPIDPKEVRERVKTTLEVNGEARNSKYKPACDVCASFLKYFANIPTSIAKSSGIIDLVYVTRGLLIAGLDTGIGDRPCKDTHYALNYYLRKNKKLAGFKAIEAWNFYQSVGRSG